MGVIAFSVGTLLEKRDAQSSVSAFVAVSIVLSIGVGMVSGGTQHYIDGPLYAAFLIPIGIAIGYYAFLFRDHKSAITGKRIGIMLLGAVVLMGILYFVAHTIPTLEDHHSGEVDVH